MVDFIHSGDILRVFVQTDGSFRPCAAGILGGSPCSPELVREISSLLGIEDVLVSESYKHTRVTYYCFNIVSKADEEIQCYEMI